MFKKITKEDVEHFLLGSDPMERIIKIEYTDYDSTKVAVFYRDENGKKQILYDDLHPFCWCKTSAAQKLYDGNRQVVKTKLAEYGITCKLLRTKKEDGSEPERMINGYKLLFQSIVPNSYTRFMEFFEKGGVPVYSKNGDKSERNYVCVAPNEQYMIATGRRLFKGYEDYDQLIRLDWDLETTGLDGEKETIDQIGMHTNKGFNKILTTIGDTVEERMSSQYNNMEEMFSIIEEIDPDVMTGYNSENFDWVFVDDQYEKYDTTMTKESAKYLRSGVYKKKKESILKLGGEMERYHQTVMSGVNITDGLHAVRRAMAIDSNIKSATLKNIAKDFKLNPKNRVYVPGNDISDIWNDLNKNYAFNEEDGDWYRYDPNYVKPKVELKKPKFSVKDYELFIEEDKATMARYRAFLQTFDGGNPEECPYCDEFFDFETGEIFDYDREYEDTDTGQSLYDAEEQRLLDEYNEANSFKKGYNGKKFTLYTRNYIAEDYELVTGRYIVERYLMDDLRETDAVELQFNQSNFLISKMLPLSFERACTMGTAGIWKYIMLAFSYENGLAIPEAENAVLSIGGLSRLERTGLCTGVAKLDYNSLYPSICLSFDYKCDVDIADAMHTMLEFVLTQREHFKEEKKKYGKAADKIKTEKEEYIKSLRETDKYKNLDDKEFGKLVGKDKKVIDFNDQYNEQKKLSSKYDKLQLPYKILGNSWFGSVSSNVFFWNSAKVGGLITSTGRMMFRLLTHHFMTMSSRQPVYVKNGECPPLDMNQLYDYQPIVGDSVTYDTPILIKYNDSKRIDIKPICELFNEAKATEFENEQWRDFSEKGYKVLSKNGWCDVGYVYKHKTNKQIKRITTKDGLIDCTEDHSLFTPQMEEKKPSEFKKGDGIAVYSKAINYNTVDEIDTNTAWLYGFFMADGNAQISEQKQTYFSKRFQEIRTYPSVKKYWKISNKNTDRLEKAKKILESKGLKCQIKDHTRSSSVYELTCYNIDIVNWYVMNFYTSYGYKKVPSIILNSSKEVKLAFMDGFCCGDGQGDTLSECVEFGQKSKIAMAGLYLILTELGINFRLRVRNDKPEFISFRFKNHRGGDINDNYSQRSHYKVWNVRDITSKSEYVYDISCDGTFVNSLGMNVLHNTDGINFKIAEKLRYTDEHPYYATGEGRNGKIGKPYTGLAADVQEFEDLYLRRKNGIDIDEVVPSSINYKRKTYSDLLENGSVKLVGNSIKSKKMPVFIEKFLDKAIPLQLYDKGKEFIEFYYDYIEKIYNYKIPLKDIASVGKIKISIDEYKQKCKETTSAGTKKSRQAWYELVIRDGMKVDMGDTIYYINTGNKKTQSDVQRVTKYFVKQSDLFNENGEIDMTKEYERELNRIKKQYKDNPSNPEIAKYLKSNGKVVSLSDYVKIEHPEAEERDEILFNCIMLPREIVEDEEDRFCEEGMEYNVEKYIEMLNKRITGLLVCFKRSMRDKVNEKGKTVSNILISNPADRKEFTDEDCQLISGEPMNESDEDKVEDVMMPEDKEIKFWLSIDQKPPYIDECGLNWEQIKKDYLERQEILQREGIRDEVEKYRFFIENTLTKAMYDDFIDDGEIPSELSNFLDVETNSMNLISKKYNVVIGSLMDIIDADFSANSWMKNDEEEAPE